MFNKKNDIQQEREKQWKLSKKLDKFYYKLFFVSGIISVVYYYYFAPISIGNDIKYNLFVISIPIIIGVVFFWMKNRNFLRFQFNDSKGFEVVFVFFLYLLMGIMFSYMTFGTVAKVTWDLVNYKIAQQNPKEIVEVKVNNFHTRNKGVQKVTFYFNENHESFRTSYQSIKKYNESGKKPRDYSLEIEIQRGIWNHYLVNKWKIKE